MFTRFDRSASALGDIRENIAAAAEFASGMTLADFKTDRLRRYALIRCLEIISEASRRLDPAIQSRHPEIPWQDIASAGNIYRHEYQDLDTRLVWGTITAALPQLDVAVAAELAAIPEP